MSFAVEPVGVKVGELTNRCATRIARGTRNQDFL